MKELRFIPETNNSVAYIDDFFSDEELDNIKQELLFITDRLQGPLETGSAKDESGELLKENRAIFLQDLFVNKTHSYIETYMDNALNIRIVDNLIEQSILFRYIKNCSRKSTMVSYYGHGDYYKQHTDASIITVLAWFNFSETDYTGGELILSDFGVEVEPKTNRVLFMPSIYLHEVRKIKFNFGGKNGRYCVSQFLMNC